MNRMDKDDHLRTLEHESSMLIDAIEARPDGAIPHCGDWTNRGLGSHIGLIWSVAATNVAATTTEPTKPGEDRRAPEDPEQLIEWLRGRRALVLDVLRSAHPDARSWTFAPDDQTAGFWQRRMACETIVHRVDAQIGAGMVPDPIDAATAADGIDEYTAVGLRFSSSRPERTYPTESLHLHCTDTDGEWMLVGDGAGHVTVTTEHGKGDAAVRGRAEDLLKWIWGRPGGRPEIFGDAGVASTWQALAP